MAPWFQSGLPSEPWLLQALMDPFLDPDPDLILVVLLDQNHRLTCPARSPACRTPPPSHHASSRPPRTPPAPNRAGTSA